MILHCAAPDIKLYYRNKSFMMKKIASENYFWNVRVFTDHISSRDWLNLARATLNSEKTIFYSLESSVHGVKYWRPYKNALLNITHKRTNNVRTFYYNLFAEEIHSEFLDDICGEQPRKSKPLLLSSNFTKIRLVNDALGEEFKDIDLYGIFGKVVRADSAKSYYHDAQTLISSYGALICVENSVEDGYIQGSFMLAFKSGAVPILKASGAIKSRVLMPNSYVCFDAYVRMSKKQRESAIQAAADYLKAGGPIFSSLTEDYLNFVENANFSNIEFITGESQKFRKLFFD